MRRVATANESGRGSTEFKETLVGPVLTADEAVVFTGPVSRERGSSRSPVSQTWMADEALNSGASLLRESRRYAMGPVSHVLPAKEAAAVAARPHAEDDNTRGVA